MKISADKHSGTEQIHRKRPFPINRLLVTEGKNSWQRHATAWSTSHHSTAIKKQRGAIYFRSGGGSSIPRALHDMQSSTMDCTRDLYLSCHWCHLENLCDYFSIQKSSYLNIHNFYGLTQHPRHWGLRSLLKLDVISEAQNFLRKLWYKYTYDKSYRKIQY
jgi:hypothetical protein